jgi:PilZ domain-containing protein
MRFGGTNSDEHKRLYARVKPSGRISSTAGIVLNPKSPIINCRLVDYSAGGACVELFSDVPLPSRFELVYGAGTKKRCRVVWKKGRRIGLAF